MGFYIQDDYYEAAQESLTKREQELYWATLIRYYFNPDYDVSNERLPKAVRGMFGTVKGRIDRARQEAQRKRAKRGQSADSPRTVGGQSADTLRRTYTEREGEKERDIDDVVVIETLYRGGEIGGEPEGFAHFQAGALKRFNAKTGQNYMGVTASSRQGMLDAFRAGRTLEDVDRVMDEVATWERKYQTLDAVWADGKFEKHLNRAEASKPVTHPVEASCPRCGETCAAVNPGMYRCKRCDITWRAS